MLAAHQANPQWPFGPHSPEAVAAANAAAAQIPVPWNADDAPRSDTLATINHEGCEVWDRSSGKEHS